MKAAFFVVGLIAAASALYLPSVDPTTELQQIANGMFEQAGLADPTTIISCFTGDSPQQTVDFVRNLTDNLADQQYFKILNIVLTYKKNSDPAVTKCLANNTEFHEAAVAYGTSNLTLMGLSKKVEQYVIANVQTIHSDFVELADELLYGNYDNYGKGAGALLQAIMA